VGPGAAGRIVSINVSSGGVPKTATPEATITEAGIEGDRHTQRRFHGGPDRAITLFSAERIASLQAEGHPIAAGTTGENLTVSGLDWELVVPGARIEIGGVRLEITKYTTPCATIKCSLRDGDIARMAQKANPGWSRVCAKVLTAGVVRVGDPVVVVD
jgi:MOSC domain-containing protein YiiM